MMSVGDVPAPRRLLTVPEVADELRVSERHARDLVARGAIASIRVGRLRRVRRDELERVLRDGVTTEASAS
jgi:excisionase family DNA binding protein